jgi:hypothetical protein
VWDLDTLANMNRPYHEPRLKPRNSLEVLIKKLKAPGPPSLHLLLARMVSSDDYAVFRRLIRELLPDYEREILEHTLPCDQMEIFLNRFGERYFELEERMELEAYGDLIFGIPLRVRGFSYDDYEDLPNNNWRDGIRLLTYLFEYPFTGDGGARTVLGESLLDIIPRELIARVPKGGYDPELMHRLLNNTRYKSVAVWGDYISGQTRNEFLDTTEEEWANSTAIEWGKEEVENLTRLSQQADVIWNGFLEVFNKLEANPPVAFGELLGYIEERRKKIESNADKAARSVPVGAAGQTRRTPR